MTIAALARTEDVKNDLYIEDRNQKLEDGHSS